MNYSNNINIQETIKQLYTFSINDVFFLFDTSNTKIAVISNELYRFINSMVKDTGFIINPKECNSYLKEITGFMQNKRNEVKRPEFRIDEYSSFAKLKSLQDLTLVVCEDCNLRCAYCYLTEKLNKKSYMTETICRRALELFFEHAQSPIHISFYGGEPLLNFKIIKYATIYALKLSKKYNFKCSFGLVSNGTICNDEIFAFLNNHNFVVNLSLDGPEKIHNRFRKSKLGKPTFDLILNNIKKYYSFYRNKDLIRFSPTIFYEDYSKVSHLYNFFKEMEKQYGISFNVFTDLKCVEQREPFTQSRNNKGYFEMLIEYAKLILEDVKNNRSWQDCFAKVRLPTEFLRALFLKKSLFSPCGAGIKSIVVYPDGSITGCRQLDSTICRGLDLTWGNVFSNYYNDELRLMPVKATATTLPDCCLGCPILKICTGFCPAYSYHSTGNFANPDPFICETQITYFKISAWLIAKAMETKIPLPKELLLNRISYGST